MTIDEELEMARARLAQLESENARLRGEQGMIRTAAPTYQAVMPSSLELRELFDVGLTRFPDLASVELDMFARAFRIAGSLHRQETLRGHSA